MRRHCSIFFSFCFMSMLLHFSALILGQSSQWWNCLGSGAWNILINGLETIDQKSERMIQAQMLENPPSIITVKTRCVWYMSAWGRRAGGCRPPRPRKPSMLQPTGESQGQQDRLGSSPSSPFSFCNSSLPPSVFLSEFPLYFLMP